MTDEELRRHFEVLAEQIDRRWDGLAKALIVLNETFDRGFAEAGEFRREVRLAFQDILAAIRLSV